MAFPEGACELTQLEEVFKQAPAFFVMLRPNHVFERIWVSYTGSLTIYFRKTRCYERCWSEQSPPLCSLLRQL